MAHTGLKSISTGTGKHFVDTHNVPWVDSNAEMVRFFTGSHIHLLLGSNAGSLESFGSNLFLFLGDKMDAAWVHIPVGLLLSVIVETELGVWYTTIET